MRPVSRLPVRTLGIAATLALALALLLPIAVTVGGAFLDLDWYGQRSEGATLQAPAELFRYVLHFWGGALGTSALLALLVVPLALLIGAPAAYAFRRRPFRGASLLEAFATMPLALPGVALAFGWLSVPGHWPRFGLLVMGHLLYTVPLVIKTVTSSLDGLDPDLEAAAQTLGAGGRERMMRVFVPILRPAFVLAALLVLAVSWGEFNVSFLLATPSVQTFPSALYLTYTNNSFAVGAAATILFLAPILPVLLLIQRCGGADFHTGLAP